MVGGEIWSSAWETWGESFPKDLIYPDNHRGIMALRRLEQGKLAASQIFLRGLRMEGWL